MGSEMCIRDRHHTKKKNPIRIILDSNATIQNNSRILRTSSKIPTIIVVAEKASKKNLRRLEKFPVQVIVCGKQRINIKKLISGENNEISPSFSQILKAKCSTSSRAPFDIYKVELKNEQLINVQKRNKSRK